MALSPWRTISPFSLFMCDKPPYSSVPLLLFLEDAKSSVLYLFPSDLQVSHRFIFPTLIPGQVLLPPTDPGSLQRYIP